MQSALLPTSALRIAAGGDTLHLRKVDIASEQCAMLLGCEAASASDLVPGLYEGGFRVWEGAIDLTAELLASTCSAAAARTDAGAGSAHICARERSGLDGTRVLELGCGHGIPGIAALLAGADVTFHVRPFRVVQ